jgi:arylsulfatase
VRSGDWKLVAEKSKDWELYHVAADRSETTDLAKQKPEMVKQLGEVYDQWANRVEAKTHQQSMKTKPSKQSQLFDLDSLVTPN